MSLEPLREGAVLLFARRHRDRLNSVGNRHGMAHWLAASLQAAGQCLWHGALATLLGGSESCLRM